MMRKLTGSSAKVDVARHVARGADSPRLSLAKLGGWRALFGFRGPVNCSVVSGSLVECTFEGSFPPYEQMEATIEVEVGSGAKSGEVNEASISGGGAAERVAETANRGRVVQPTNYGVSLIMN